MAHYDLNFSDYERIFRKRFKILTFVILVACLSSFTFYKLKPPLYKTGSSVRVDKSSRATMGMNMFSYMAWDNIATQEKVATSFPVVKKAAVIMKLIPEEYNDIKTISDPKIMAKINSLSGKVSAMAQTGAKIIDITVTSGNKEEARDLANAMAYAYKEYTYEEKKEKTLKTASFVKDQLKRSRDEIESAEREKKKFESTLKIPSVKKELEHTISDVSDMEKKIAILTRKERIIKSEREKFIKKLRKPEFVTNSEKRTEANQKANTNAKVYNIDWMTNVDRYDQGMHQLNVRLLNMQFKLRESLSYYKSNHPTVIALEANVKSLVSQLIKEYDQRLIEINKERTALQSRLAETDKYLDTLSGKELDYARIIRKVKMAEDAYTQLAVQYREVAVDEASIVDDITIMSLAGLPTTPINKGLFKILFAGTLIGLLLGIVVAILREILDTSIGTIEDVEEYLKLPVMGVIPHIDMPAAHDSSTNRLITQFDPKNPSAEAYRILRTNLEFSSVKGAPIKTLMVTSSTMQEGKSTTLSNLAITFAQEGKKILLIGANMRRPSLYRVFGLDKGPGLADILVGKAKWQDCIRNASDLAVGKLNIEDFLATPGIENLNIITFGKIPPNPSELLASNNMDKLLAETSKEYDIVLVDSPPLLPVADASLISTKTDAALLIYRVGKTPRNSLKRGKERLENVNAKLLGLALNDIRPEISGASYVSQYYMHYYGEKTKKTDSGHKIKINDITKVLTLSLLTVLGSGLIAAALATPSKTLTTAKYILYKVGVTIPLVLTLISNPFVEDSNKSKLATKNIVEDKPKIEKIQTKDIETAELTNNENISVGVNISSAEPQTVANKKKIYTVQLLTLKNRNIAESIVSELQSEGIPAWIKQKQHRSKGLLYRVCAGKFSTKYKANMFYKNRISKVGYKDAFTVLTSTELNTNEDIIALKNRKVSFYSVQLCAFKNKETANNISKNILLNEKDVKTVWVGTPKMLNNNTVYPVRVGRFSNKKEAEIFKKKLCDGKRDKYKGAFIVSFPQNDDA